MDESRVREVIRRVMEKVTRRTDTLGSLPLFTEADYMDVDEVISFLFSNNSIVLRSGEEIRETYEKKEDLRKQGKGEALARWREGQKKPKE